jgi:hypothetical protein
LTKSWRELVSEEDAISLIRGSIAGAPTDIAVLDSPQGTGQRALEALQVTTRSPLGAVAFHTGGILVDHGWLRILGSGAPRLPRAIDLWNGVAGSPRFAQGLLIADDALGGFFAWFTEPRTVHYLSPDTFEWEDLELGYSDWLSWCFTDRLAKFYDGFRWDGWVPEVEALDGGDALHVWPPLVAKGPVLAHRSRRAVPVEELWHLTLDLQGQLRGIPNGAAVRFTGRE